MLKAAIIIRCAIAKRHAVTGASVVVLLLLPASAVAGETAERLLRCAEQSDSTKRLACFDRLAAQHSEPDPTDRGAASGSRWAETDAEQWFGMESHATLGLSAITANVVGGFAGWDGRTQFELDNGQVWAQIAADRFRHTGADVPVVIRRSALGGFLLSPDGLNRSVRVRRIR